VDGNGDIIGNGFEDIKSSSVKELRLFDEYPIRHHLLIVTQWDT